jgi:hypothetical protein
MRQKCIRPNQEGQVPENPRQPHQDCLSSELVQLRNVPDDLAKALELEKRRREKSLNQTVIELLSQGLREG